MIDAVVVGVAQPVGDRAAQPQHLVDRQRRAARPLAQRVAGDVLERQVEPTAVLAEVVELDNVRVVEPRDRSRLVEEPLGR